MTHVPGLAAFAAATMPVFAGRIPPSPARLLGRLAVPEHDDPLTPPGSGHAFAHRRGDEPDHLVALRALGMLPVERLLGALELTVAGHDWSGAPDLLAGLPQPPDIRYAFTASGGHDSDAVTASGLLHRLRPGLADRTVELVRELAAEPAAAAHLAVPPTLSDEPSIAGAHGAAHLGLAVSVAGAVVHQADPPVIVDRAAATVGLAVGAAALLLRQASLPPAYADALLAKVRAEYLLPSHGSGTVTVAQHRFGLAEGQLPEVADFSGNGLVGVADAGVVVRTGVSAGSLRVDLVVLAEPPAEVETHWEDVVEVSWRAARGRASVVPVDGNTGRGLRGRTPPWPGDYRVRVHARGRDDLAAQLESYKLIVWAAPAAPEIVHRRTDRLGHRLRGEPAPARPPQHAYRWMRLTEISEAATVTVVTGATVERVLSAFGADPARPEPIDAIERDLSLRQTIDGWVAVLDAGDTVVAVEFNGYRGADGDVLRAASTGGRAASMYWNVNAVTRLSFAEGGVLLAAHEPWGHEEWPPEVLPALDGLDFAEVGDRAEKGLVAVERFTGRGLLPDDLDRIRQAGTGYRITAGS